MNSIVLVLVLSEAVLVIVFSEGYFLKQSSTPAFRGRKNRLTLPAIGSVLVIQQQRPSPRTLPDSECLERDSLVYSWF